MITVVGIFEHRRPAESAAWHLRMLGIEPGNVDLSAPREASRSAPLPRFSCCLVLGRCWHWAPWEPRFWAWLAQWAATRRERAWIAH
jgi:hypothetical protein